MRIFLASLLLTIFSFQILPVRAIGKILFKAQLTEELHEEDSPEDGDDPFDMDFTSKFKESLPASLRSSFPEPSYAEYRIAGLTTSVIHRSQFLEDQHYPDIFVPPPNA
ncbi:hypothetical protein [Rurimicrobium arvi]|uniref:Uncharacterized protein n=1 Tax=Rurimicrobium arvi TaxID=2049916 RepID=A0ABP8MRZ4_9BACT